MHTNTQRTRGSGKETTKHFFFKHIRFFVTVLDIFTPDLQVCQFVLFHNFVDPGGECTKYSSTKHWTKSRIFGDQCTRHGERGLKYACP